MAINGVNEADTDQSAHYHSLVKFLLIGGGIG